MEAVFVGKPANNEMPIETVEDLEREIFNIEQDEEDASEEEERRRKEFWINHGIQNGFIMLATP